jgi:hypothetical protein
MQTSIESARWRRSQIAETFASVRVSAPSYSLAEDVGFVAVVEPKLKLREVQRQILLTNMVIGTDDATLEQAPEVFKIVRVNLAAHIFTLAMRHKFVFVALSVQVAISAMLIGCDQINLLADGVADESIKRLSVGVFDNLADHVAFPANCSDDAHLSATNTTRDVAFLIPMAVLILPADEGLIDFDDAHKLTKIGVFHCGAQTMAHIPSRLVGSAPDLALNLKRADTLFAVQNLPENLKPDGQRIFGVLKDRPNRNGEPIGRLATQLADPVEGLPVELTDLSISTTRAPYHAIRPTVFAHELLAGCLVGEGLHQLSERHHV